MPVLALLLLAGVWGYNWVVIKIALYDAGPFQFAALRALLGALALFAAMLAARRPLKPVALPGLALVGLLQTAGFLGLSTWALVYGGAGKVAVLAYTMPFWVLLLAWPLLGERIRGLQWLAIVLAFAGLLAIIDPRRISAAGIGADMLAIVSGLAWAGGTVVAKRLRFKGDIDILSLTTWQMFLGSIPLVLVALAVPEPPIHWTVRFILAMGYNIIPATALGWFLWLYAVAHLPAGTAGLGSLLNPAVGIAAAWIQLHEVPSGGELLGIVLIIAGLAVTALAARGPAATAASA